MKEVAFTLSDGLLLKGSLLDNENSKDLIIMLHSGGYDQFFCLIKETTAKAVKMLMLLQ